MHKNTRERTGANRSGGAENPSKPERTRANQSPCTALWTTLSGFESLPPSQLFRKTHPVPIGMNARLGRFLTECDRVSLYGWSRILSGQRGYGRYRCNPSDRSRSPRLSMTASARTVHDTFALSATQPSCRHRVRLTRPPQDGRQRTSHAQAPSEGDPTRGERSEGPAY